MLPVRVTPRSAQLMAMAVAEGVEVWVEELGEGC